MKKSSMMATELGIGIAVGAAALIVSRTMMSNRSPWKKTAKKATKALSGWMGNLQDMM